MTPCPFPADIISGLVRTALVSQMDTVIGLSQLDQGKAREDLKPFPPLPLSLSSFLSFPGPLGLFMLLFGDASVLTRRSEVARPQELFRSFSLDALSPRFTTHTGLCHSPRTQPSLMLACMYVNRQSGACRQTPTFIALGQLLTIPDVQVTRVSI